MSYPAWYEAAAQELKLALATKSKVQPFDMLVDFLAEQEPETVGAAPEDDETEAIEALARHHLDSFLGWLRRHGSEWCVVIDGRTVTSKTNPPDINELERDRRSGIVDMTLSGSIAHEAPPKGTIRWRWATVGQLIRLTDTGVRERLWSSICMLGVGNVTSALVGLASVGEWKTATALLLCLAAAGATMLLGGLGWKFSYSDTKTIKESILTGSYDL